MTKHICIIMLAAFFLIPQAASAHASLTQAVPAADSQLDHAPEQVILTFNERLENELYYIKLLNQNGKSVTSNAAIMNEQQSEIRLDLPKEVPDGRYTVTYKVISADGHPISESYVITVGQPNLSQPSSDELNQYHQHDITADMSSVQLLTFISRVAYFLSLLLLVGWTFWAFVARTGTEELRKSYETWLKNLLKIFMLSLLFMIAVQVQDYVDEFNYIQVKSLLFGTAIGISWVSSYLLTVLGFILLNRSKWIDGIWILLMLVAKSINGHAMAFEPPFRTIMLDIVHLCAAAIWAGGLLYIIVHGRTYKEHIQSFMPKFSNYAFASLIALTLSGILSTLIFLPSLKYVLFTQWGILLIAKCILVIFVIVVAMILRTMMRKKQRTPNTLLKVDFSLMLLIVLIVSVFTYLNPQPVSEPLYWHEMGETIHLTAKITPKVPGDNTFEVDLWMQAEPKAVQYFLAFRDKDVAPIEIPLAIVAGDETEDLWGLKKYSYTSQGPYLPFPGTWALEIRVMDVNDVETVYHREMIIY